MPQHANRIRVGQQGRLVIPASVRKALHLKAGDTLNVAIDSGRIVLESQNEAWERLQQRFAAVKGKISMVDELIAERRAEAAREEAEMRKYLK